MNIQEFYNYIKHPDLLNETSLNELNEVLQRYPYFQAARMLYLKNLSQLNDDRYQAVLTQTSIYAPDRKTLYFLIHQSEEKKENQIIVEKEESKSTIPPVETQKTLEVNTEQTTKNEILAENKEEYKPNTIEINKEQKTENKLSTNIADLVLNKINEIKQSKPCVQVENIDKNEVFETKEEEASTLTFDEWLYYVSTHKTKIKQNEESLPEKSIIDQFLENSSNLSRIKVEQGVENEDLTEHLTPPEELEIVSETLAQLYYKQGYFDKALKMYEKLILKYPEKSIYFASSIQEIKNKLDKS